MIRLIQRTLLFATIFLCISQFGKHFWPDFSYVSGIRVDYLSPTLYLSDLLIGLLGVFSFRSLLISGALYLKKFPLVVLMSIGALLASCLLAQQPLVALYGLVKVIEMAFFGYMVYHLLSQKDFSVLATVIAGAVSVQTMLVIWQFLAQSSVGGLWYYLGERSFSSGTVGIATVSIYGQELLRAYGSFPHPNVLAFFMFLSSLVLMVYATYTPQRWEKIGSGIIAACAVLALFLTFSRLTILLFIAAIVFLVYKRVFSAKIGGVVLLVCVLGIVAMLPRFSFSFFTSPDFTYRVQLALIALDILKQHLLFGVGLFNYFMLELPYQKEITPVLLQPVHNIYLLVLLQLGLIGSVPVILFFKNTSKQWITLMRGVSSQNPLSLVALILFAAVLIIGMADHFFLTLQQGMLMLSLVIGLVWMVGKKAKG